MLIVGVMETINLAHGSLFALGMYVAIFIVTPRFGFPELQASYVALPLGTRYAIALLLAPVVVGVFGTTWYYRLDLPGVKEFVEKYQKTFPGMAIRVPGNVYYNGYMATRELLHAVERAGSTNNLKVIRELEGLKVPARDRLQHFDAYMNPQTHQIQQTIYMASYNDAPAEKDDIFKIMTQVPPKDVEDQAAPAACKLESYESTPSYEQ